MSTDGHGTKRRRTIAENFIRLRMAHERYRRQTTDGRAIAFSEREREFTFAKNGDAQKKRSGCEVRGVSPEAGRESLVLYFHCELTSRVLFTAKIRLSLYV